MNKLLLLLVVTFAYVYADEESVEFTSSEEESVRELAAVLQSKFNTTILTDFVTLVNATKSRCPGIDEKLDKVSDETAECIDAVDVGDDTLCTAISKNLETCFAPFRKVLIECLPAESKGLPITGIKIFKAIFDQFCNSTVEELLELFNPCAFENNFESFDTCVKVKNVLTQYRDTVPSKSLICSILPNLKSCAKSRREASCKNPVTKSALIKFYDSIDGTTASECQDLNKIRK